ncbi:unnamed protein product, partial [Ectocarpus sp. 6 AP-2014]
QAVWETWAVAIYCFFFVAPFLHVVYDALEKWIPADKSQANAIAQVTIDSLVVETFLGLTFIVMVGFLEGETWEEDIVPTIKSDYLTLVVWLMVTKIVMGPAQVYLFVHFPLKWRVLIADGKGLLLNFIACFIVE